MTVVSLIAAALILPLVWGWVVYWLVERFWPAENARRSADPLPAGDASKRPIDYQI